MKVFVILSVIAFVAGARAFTDEQREKGLANAGQCATELGVDKEVILKLKGGDYSVQDSKVECFVKCFFEKSGFFDGAGNFVHDVALQKLTLDGTSADSVEALFAKCVKTDADPCVKAFNTFKCFQEQKSSFL